MPPEAFVVLIARAVADAFDAVEDVGLAADAFALELLLLPHPATTTAINTAATTPLARNFALTELAMM